LEAKLPWENRIIVEEVKVVEIKVKNKSKDAPEAAKEQPDIYTPIHKGLRSRLFKTSVKAGTLDYTDQASLQEFSDEFSSLVESIRVHHTMEENFYHPLLAERVPGGAEKLDEEHQTVEHLLHNLKAHLDRIRSKSTKFEKRKELCLEFYLAFNRFIAFFLGHIDAEEEHYQPTLRNLFTIEELDKAEIALIASQKPEEGLENWQMMLGGANTDELANLLVRARIALPPEVIQGGLQLAESALSARDLVALKAKAGVK
jgi:hemerythrin-like domain-containing protein